MRPLAGEAHPSACRGAPGQQRRQSLCRPGATLSPACSCGL